MVIGHTIKVRWLMGLQFFEFNISQYSRVCQKERSIFAWLLQYRNINFFSNLLLFVNRVWRVGFSQAFISIEISIGISISISSRTEQLIILLASIASFTINFNMQRLLHCFPTIQGTWCSACSFMNNSPITFNNYPIVSSQKWLGAIKFLYVQGLWDRIWIVGYIIIEFNFSYIKSLTRSVGTLQSFMHFLKLKQ